MEQLMTSFEQFGLVVQYYVAVIALDLYILVNSNIIYRVGNAEGTDQQFLYLIKSTTTSNYKNFFGTYHFEQY